ncbi:recombinase RecT [Acinetobacter lwoffii]|uniref:recombinase RecT n=1 Tax=Acinetobacter lwoffii TaxID=28090 RepID=UPI00209A8646|nr:recombinase RecT [Acinetobacter lwoffii]MCO8073130.1 recombinase RecT [Acinetobacter lwoffii]MCO8076055.1 recombinase RecT [Acinetobacter lwoffii]
MTSQVMTTEQLRAQRKPENVEANFNTYRGFQAMHHMAESLANSTIIPEAFRNTLMVKDRYDQQAKKWLFRPEANPNGVSNCIIALNMAQRLGADPMMIMQNLYLVDGRPSWSSQFIIAAINSSGRYSPLRFDITGGDEEVEIPYAVTEWIYNQATKKKEPVESNQTARVKNYKCVAWVVEKATGERLESTPITMEMAVKEGWYQKNGSKWQSMPEQMLRYRAASFFGRIYAPDLLMGLRTQEEEMESIIDITPEPAPQEAPQTLDSIKQNVVKEVVTDAPAEEKPKRSRQTQTKTFTQEVEAPVEDIPPAQQAKNVQNQTSNDVGDGELSVNELKRLQEEAEALVQQKKQPSSTEMKKEYAKALNTAKSLADILDIEEQIENDNALTQTDFQYLQANIEQVRTKFETSQAPAVDPIKSGSVKNGLTLLISDAKNGEDIRQVAQQMNAAKPNLTNEHQQELLQAYAQKKKLIEDQMDMFPNK